MVNSLNKKADNTPVETTTFYKTAFLKANPDQQKAFIEMIFTQDADLCRRFLRYIQPSALPLSHQSTDLNESSTDINNSTDLDELSNEIAARITEIDADDYLLEESDDGGYDDDDVRQEQYDIKALGGQVLTLIQPYGVRAIKALENGQLIDSARVLLSIYEAQFLVEEPDLEHDTPFSYQSEIHHFFEQTTTLWIEKAEKKTFKQGDYDAILTLILARWKNFKRFHGKAESAPYELFNADLFVFIIQNAKAEKQFLEFMTDNKLHTFKHYELTKKLCNALNKNDFLLEQLAVYGLDSAALSKELMQQYIDRNNRPRFLSAAQKAYEKYAGEVSEFIAENLLSTDNLGFFKRILSEVAAQKQRLDLYHRWREHVSPDEQKAYFDLQETRNEAFYMALLNDSERFLDILDFAEESVENFNSNAFEIAAKLLIHKYPDDIFPLYCERIILFMNNGASSKNHYEIAVSMLKPLKEIKGKEAEIKEFAEELRKKYARLPVFLEELKKAGF